MTSAARRLLLHTTFRHLLITCSWESWNQIPQSRSAFEFCAKRANHIWVHITDPHSGLWKTISRTDSQTVLIALKFKFAVCTQATVSVYKCCNTDGNLPPLPLQGWCLWVGVQKPTGKCNIDWRDEEGYVINSFDALHLLFKRSVTTIYDRDCR